MTTSSRERAVEERRSHRSLARKLAWRHTPHPEQELTFADPIRSWVARSRTAMAEKFSSGSAGYYTFGDQSSRSQDIDDFLDVSPLRFYFVAPSLRDPEGYGQYREGLEHLHDLVVHPHHGSAHWLVLVPSPRQFDRSGERPEADDTLDDLVREQDPFWEEVPNEELIRRHSSTSIGDPSELKLELWDSDEEFESFVRAIDEARRSDTI